MVLDGFPFKVSAPGRLLLSVVLAKVYISVGVSVSRLDPISAPRRLLISVVPAEVGGLINLQF